MENLKKYIIRNIDNIPLKEQEVMTFRDAVKRYYREINSLKQLNIYTSDYDFNLYDVLNNKQVDYEEIKKEYIRIIQKENNNEEDDEYDEGGTII